MPLIFPIIFPSDAVSESLRIFSESWKFKFMVKISSVVEFKMQDSQICRKIIDYEILLLYEMHFV